MNNNYPEETEINLLHMCLTILKKWKSLLLAMVLGLILGLLIGEIKKSDITDEIKENNTQLELYQSLYDETEDYLNNSPIMNMESPNVYMGYIDVYVDCGTDNAKCEKILQNILNDETFYETIRSMSGLDTDTKYLREIVSSSSSSSSSMAIDVTIDSLNNQSRTGKANGDVVTYTVVYDDEAVVNSIVGILNDFIESDISSLNDTYSDGEVYVFQSGTTVYQTADYINSKMTYITNLAKYRDEIDSLKTDTDVSKLVFKKVVKYMIIGMIGGAFIWFCIWAAIYVLNGRVKTMDDIRTAGVGKIYGLRSCTDEVKGIKKALENTEGRKVSLDYVSNALKKDFNADELYIYKLGQSNWNEADLPADLDGITVAEGLMSENIDVLNSAVAKKNTVMFVKLGDTKMSAVLSELETAKNSGVNVVAVVGR